LRPTYNIKILNRWGQLIFESNDAEYGWDGTFKGKIQEMGVYLFVIKYVEGGQTISKEIKGNFTLLK